MSHVFIALTKYLSFCLKEFTLTKTLDKQQKQQCYPRKGATHTISKLTGTADKDVKQCFKTIFKSFNMVLLPRLRYPARGPWSVVRGPWSVARG